MLCPWCSHSSWLVVALALIAAPLSAQEAKPLARVPLASTQQAQLVVLRNGEVLTGTVTAAGERVLIMLPGRQISLRSSEIDVVARTMDEACLLKRNKLRPTDVDGRLDLAAWCIHHRLWTRAQEELVAASDVQPGSSRLAAIRQHLHRSVAHESAEQRPANETSADSTNARSPADQAAARRPKDTATRAAYSWPPLASNPSANRAADPVRTLPRTVEHETKAALADSPAAMAESPAALERFVLSLPDTAVEQFTSGLHPMLARSCATAGCHAPGNETGFTLLRLPHRRAPSRRLTQRNLYNIVQLVDFSHPQDSRLLELASQPHGPLKAGVFGDARSPKYRDLVTWITALTGSPANGGDGLPVDQRTAIVDWDRARYSADRTAPLAQSTDINAAMEGAAADELRPNQPAEVRSGDRQ